MTPDPTPRPAARPPASPPPSRRRSGRAAKALLVALLLTAGALATAAPAVAAEDGDAVLRRDHSPAHVSDRLLESWFWELCRDHPGDVCNASVKYTEAGTFVSLVAPTSVQRQAVELLLQRDVPPPDSRLRVDLLLTAGSDDGATPGTRDLQGLSTEARRTVEALPSALRRHGLRHLDTALLRVGSAAAANLGGDARLFTVRIDLAPPPRPGSPGVRVRELGLHCMRTADDGPLMGRVLATSLDLEPGVPTLAGVSRIGDGTERVLLLLTLEP